MSAPKVPTADEIREAQLEAAVLVTEASFNGASKVLSDFDRRMAWDVLTCKLFPGKRFGGYLRPKRPARD